MNNTDNIMHLDFLRQERSVIGRIFTYALEVIHITDNFHIYSIDCRLEKNLSDVVKKIDRLMDNEAIPQKETVSFPRIFQSHLPGEQDLKNINAVINKDYKSNYITGSRKEPSKLRPGYFHNISWVGIILNKELYEMSRAALPGIYEMHFKNSIQFMQAYVPDNLFKWQLKLDAIKKQYSPRTELEQYFGITRKVRRDLYESVKDLESQIMSTYPKVANDVMDIIRITDVTEAPAEKVNGIII